MATRCSLGPLPRVAARCTPSVALLATIACSRQDGAAEDSARDATLVTVSAHAEARRAPDIATLSTGVVSLAPDANGAIRLNSQRMARVVEAIKAAGIAGKDVQTS